MLRHPEFHSRLCLLAIDELHLVEDWKEFRPDYTMLGVLRTRLPYGTPLLRVTATLDPLLISRIKASCSFEQNINIIQSALNRPEIFIQCSMMKGTIKGMQDLQHLLPPVIVSPVDIPETVVFMDSVPLVMQAYRHLKCWMKMLGYPGNVDNLVQPYFSAMATRDKERIAASFAVRSEDLEEPRIIVSTEAYGIGIDNPDISRVVQWGVPSSMARMYQRMGRAMRSGDSQARFLLLFSPAMVGPTESIPGLNKKKRAAVDARAKLHHSMWRVMNEKAPVCLGG